mgnify:CR=1 FL=1
MYGIVRRKYPPKWAIFTLGCVFYVFFWGRGQPIIVYRSAAAHRKNEWKSLIFDFDTEFLHQNSELSKNGWYHWIRLALLRRNQLSLFNFKPIIEPPSCIQRRRLRWVIFTHFATPPTIPDFYRAQCVSREKKKKNRAGRENSNVPSIVEKK